MADRGAEHAGGGRAERAGVGRRLRGEAGGRELINGVEGWGKKWREEDRRPEISLHHPD